MKYILLLTVLLFTVSCSRNHSPIAKGDLVSIRIADKSLIGDPKSHSTSTFHGGTVELYPNFIIFTTKDGLSKVTTYDRVKKLEYKK